MRTAAIPHRPSRVRMRIVAIAHRPSRREDTKIAQGETLGKLAPAEFPPKRGGTKRKLVEGMPEGFRDPSCVRSIRPCSADFPLAASFPGLRSPRRTPPWAIFVSSLRELPKGSIHIQGLVLDQGHIHAKSSIHVKGSLHAIAPSRSNYAAVLLHQLRRDLDLLMPRASRHVKRSQDHRLALRQSRHAVKHSLTNGRILRDRT
jgi:hypothetical protein